MLRQSNSELTAIGRNINAIGRNINQIARALNTSLDNVHMAQAAELGQVTTNQPLMIGSILSIQEWTNCLPFSNAKPKKDSGFGRAAHS